MLYQIQAFFMTVFERLVPARNPDVRLQRHPAATVPDGADSTSGDASSNTSSVSSPTAVPTVSELISELGLGSPGSHDNILPEFISPISTHVYKDFEHFTTLASVVVKRADIVFHRDMHSSF
jgi:hypothetical protein